MISSIAGIVVWVIGLVVVIKIFQKEGVMKGILALICSLYTYIWGWQHAKEQNLTGMMWTWTIIIVISIIAGVVGGMQGAGGGGGEVIPTPEATQEGLRIISRLFM
jgi:uncharacterized membrane protein YfcA